MGEGNVGDGQEAWQSYTDGPIGLRTYFIFSKYLSLSLKKLTKCPFSLVTLDCDMFRYIASVLISFSGQLFSFCQL